MNKISFKNKLASLLSILCLLSGSATATNNLRNHDLYLWVNTDLTTYRILGQKVYKRKNIYSLQRLGVKNRDEKLRNIQDGNIIWDTASLKKQLEAAIQSSDKEKEYKVKYHTTNVKEKKKNLKIETVQKTAKLKLTTFHRYEDKQSGVVGYYAVFMVNNDKKCEITITALPKNIEKNSKGFNSQRLTKNDKGDFASHMYKLDKNDEEANEMVRELEVLHHTNDIYKYYKTLQNPHKKNQDYELNFVFHSENLRMLKNYAQNNKNKSKKFFIDNIIQFKHEDKKTRVLAKGFPRENAKRGTTRTEPETWRSIWRITNPDSPNEGNPNVKVEKIKKEEGSDEIEFNYTRDPDKYEYYIIHKNDKELVTLHDLSRNEFVEESENKEKDAQINYDKAVWPLEACYDLVKSHIINGEIVERVSTNEKNKKNGHGKVLTQIFLQPDTLGNKTEVNKDLDFTPNYKPISWNKDNNKEILHYFNLEQSSGIIRKHYLPVVALPKHLIHRGFNFNYKGYKNAWDTPDKKMDDNHKKEVRKAHLVSVVEHRKTQNRRKDSKYNYRFKENGIDYKIEITTSKKKGVAIKETYQNKNGKDVTRDIISCKDEDDGSNLGGPVSVILAVTVTGVGTYLGSTNEKMKGAKTKKAKPRKTKSSKSKKKRK